MKKKAKAKKKRPTKAKGVTHVNFLLDETASMMSNKEATISGFNEYLKTLKDDLRNKYHFWLTLFNTSKTEHRYQGVDIGEVKELNAQNYRPAECTPLYDAIVSSVRKMEDNINGEPVITVILTDGEENSSKDATLKITKELIEEKTKGGWQFIYLGAHEAAWQEGFKLSAGTTVMFQNNATQMHATMTDTARAVMGYATSGGKLCAGRISAHYNPKQTKTSQKWTKVGKKIPSA
jgi:hypothetical protein